VKAGDLVRFSQEHWEKPGVAYTKDWIGIIVEKVVNSVGVIEEVHILWKHGKVSDYPSSWWNRLTYFPFEVISESG